MPGAKSAKLRVALVQQGYWRMPLESIPLAAGYLKATAMADGRLADDVEIDIYSFDGSLGAITMAQRLFAEEPPDVLGFSCLAWNYHPFGAVAETYRRLRPDGWVIFGGNHVTHQAERTFRLYPWVDIVLDGEGEVTFCELLAHRLADPSPHDLDDVLGVAFKRADGEIVQNPERGRIQDLSQIPSPFLSGALPIENEHGRFRYEAALMETNRGCPYKCAFCYWGGAIGQKVRKFPLERLREEVELLASLKVETIAMCDANFGMLPSDLDFVNFVVEAREKYGYPLALESSWAKNKSDTFYAIVDRLREAGLRSSFTLSLQTLDDDVLRQAGRRNMPINKWETLANWLDEHGMVCNSELIWGLPGETPESFLAGYDKLARRTSNISVYPLLLMPNTHYWEHRDEFGFVTTRGEHDDFEFPIAHNTMSVQDNQRIQRFMFAARTIAEAHLFRDSFRALDILAGISQSEILLSMLDFFDACDHPDARLFHWDGSRVVDGDAVSEALRRIYAAAPAVEELFDRWWHEWASPRVPAENRLLAREIFRHDQVTRPIYDVDGTIPTTSVDGVEMYVKRGVEFMFDMDKVIADIRRRSVPSTDCEPTVVDVHFATGFHQHIDSHDVVTGYVGTLTPRRDAELVAS